jgi:diaminohydroxyphosphoribosylaminopyrimidine deaminase/5-amino-6-(5-phosphoribosylamino)uracil reductase
MFTAETYMQRCLELANRGMGRVAPNPMVGALIVHDNRILAEGWHAQYGGPHAEVHCIESLNNADRALLPASTLYVSLEPCCHHGKTPPCTDLIIASGIKQVVVGCLDPFEKVRGTGIQRLQDAGIDVITGVLEKECQWINRRFITFHQRKRPHIILKWAQTADGFIAGPQKQRLSISQQMTNRLVHHWRTEEMAILVGYNTVVMDDPLLTTRFWPGKNPIRLVIDTMGALPTGKKIFNADAPTMVFSFVVNKHPEIKTLLLTDKHRAITEQVLEQLFNQSVQSVLIEGGRHTLSSFMDAGFWDEIRVITNTKMEVGEGFPGPVLPTNAVRFEEIRLADDVIHYYRKDTHGHT